MHPLPARPQLPEGAANLVGQLNLVEFSGAVTPPPGTRVRAATKPGSKASFNGGRALVGNYFQLQAVPDKGECVCVCVCLAARAHGF